MKKLCSHIMFQNILLIKCIFYFNCAHLKTKLVKSTDKILRVGSLFLAKSMIQLGDI